MAALINTLAKAPENTAQHSVQHSVGASISITGVTEKFIANTTLQYPLEKEYPLEKAIERRKKKIGWLSKFAGWSGHAALINNCPEYFAAEAHA